MEKKSGWRILAYVVLGFVGWGLIWLNADWKVALGLFLLFSAYTLEHF